MTFSVHPYSDRLPVHFYLSHRSKRVSQRLDNTLIGLKKFTGTFRFQTVKQLRVEDRITEFLAVAFLPAPDLPLLSDGLSGHFLTINWVAKLPPSYGLWPPNGQKVAIPFFFCFFCSMYFIPNYFCVKSCLAGSFILSQIWQTFKKNNFILLL